MYRITRIYFTSEKPLQMSQIKMDLCDLTILRFGKDHVFTSTNLGFAINFYYANWSKLAYG